MTSVAGLMSWFGIAVTYIQFHKGLKAQGFDRDALPYKAWAQPYAAYYAAVSCIVICFVRPRSSLPSPAPLLFSARNADAFVWQRQFSGWEVFLRASWASDTFVTNYFPLMLFPVLYAGARLWTRRGLVAPADMDFKTGIAEIEAACYDEPPARNWVERVWGWLVRALIPAQRSGNVTADGFVFVLHRCDFRAFEGLYWVVESIGIGCRVRYIGCQFLVCFWILYTVTLLRTARLVSSVTLPRARLAWCSCAGRQYLRLSIVRAEQDLEFSGTRAFKLHAARCTTDVART